MFSSSLDTIPFHFILDFYILLHLDSNHLIISSSHRCRCLLSGRFQSHRYHSNCMSPPVVCESCVVFDPAKILLSVPYNHVLHSAPLRMCSRSYFSNMNIFIALCMLICLCFFYSFCWCTFHVRISL